jgi:hypothetical protein
MQTTRLTNNIENPLELLVRRERDMHKVDVDSPITVQLIGRKIQIVHNGMEFNGDIERPLIHQIGGRAWGQSQDFHEIERTWRGKASQNPSELEHELGAVFRNHKLTIRYETDDRGYNKIYGIVTPHFTDVNQLEFRASFIEQARHSTTLNPQSQGISLGAFGEVVEFFDLNSSGFQTQYKYGLVYAKNNGYDAYKVNWKRYVLICTNGLRGWAGKSFAWKHTKEVELSKFIDTTVQDGVGNQNFIEERILESRQAELNRNAFDELMARLSLCRASKTRVIDRLAVESKAVGNNEWALSQTLTWLGSHENAISARSQAQLTGLGTDVLEHSLEKVLEKKSVAESSGLYGIVLPKNFPKA